MNSTHNLLFKCLRRAAWGLLALVLAGSPALAAELSIVTTTSDLASIARSVAGDDAKVRSICTGKQDPHFIQAKPSYIMAARKADLWIRVGMELEIGWEGPVLDGARNRSIREGSPGHLDASENVLRLEVPNKRITRAMGDVHPMGNPHYWLDPMNARIVAKSIADRLIELNPDQAETYRNNLAAFQQALDEHMFGPKLLEVVKGDKLWALEAKGELDGFLRSREISDKVGGWWARLRPFRGRKIVTYHRSWIYFANRFGLKVACELEPKPGIPPTAAHLADVIGRVKEQKIPVILMEPFYTRKSADTVASKSDAVVLVCPNAVGGDPGATDYLTLIDLIVDRLSEDLKTKDAK